MLKGLIIQSNGFTLPKVTEEWIIEMQTSQNLIDMESTVLKGK